MRSRALRDENSRESCHAIVRMSKTPSRQCSGAERLGVREPRPSEANEKELSTPDGDGEGTAGAAGNHDNPDREKNSIEESGEKGSYLTPSSSSFQRLLRLDRASLIAEQDNDQCFQKLRNTTGDGVGNKNVSFHTKAGLLYRHYRDKQGRVHDQLVVPAKYREDILQLTHGSSWSGHLGVRKTKQRLLQ